MKEFKKEFIKQGGVDLLRKYKKAGVLFVAVIEFLCLGKSKKALEILRLSIQFKIQNKLKRKYKHILNNFNTLDNTLPKNQSNKVWVCWFQGMENAPLLVQRCFDSLKKNLYDKEVILITYDNLLDYVTFPNYILEKWKSGKITNTHFSNMLRLELLIKYGGLWIDSTVLCTGNDNLDYIFQSNLFMYQILKPGRDGHCIFISSWLISSCTNNTILMATRAMLYEYWKKNNSLIDYHVFHHFFCIACEFFQDEWKSVIKQSNSIPHILLLDIFEPYDEKVFKEIKKMSNFHKLSYKLDDKLINKENTYYDVIIRQGKINI